jgi:signal transduction histidine kinase
VRRRSVTSLGETAEDGNSASPSAVARRGTGPEAVLATGTPGTGTQTPGGPQAPAATPPAARPGPGRQAPKTRSRFAPSNWRVRWRLAAVIAIPTIAAAVLGALQISSDAGNYQAFGRVQTLVNLNTAVVQLTQNLEDERDKSAGYVGSGRIPAELGPVSATRAATNATILTVQAAANAIGSGGGFQAGTVQDLNALLASINDLSNIRSVVTASKLPAAQVVRVYTNNLIDVANTFSAAVGSGANDANLQGNVTTLATLLRAENQMSVQRAILFAALSNVPPVLGPEDLSTLQQAATEEAAQEADFKASASQTEFGLFSNTVAGTQVDSAAEEEQLAITLASTPGTAANPSTPLTAHNSGLNAGDWYNNMSARINDTRRVTNGLGPSSLVDQISSRASALKSDAGRSLVLASIITLLVLLLVLLISTLVARSLTRPLRKLRSDALDVAGHRLPDIVRRLSQSEGADEGVEIEPIGVTSTDEIGEVARAFDQVHREAVRLAADEAMLRGNLNAMFINLSRRSQSLIERQLSLIDNLEQSEQDPGRLSSLFRLDHLATRMRRNSENLLVLAGHEVARRWSQPVPLVDVLRAAISEIEQYERVVLNVQPGIVVVGQAVNDVVHLVAEIVENATTFSPEDTQVYVSGQPLSSGGVLLDITDNGVGISDQEMSHANWRLDNPPVVDVAVSRRMGLFVVGRLAARHGVRVRLRHAQAGGLTALIWLPETVAAPEVAPPLGRLRRFEADDYGPAPSLSAPPASGSTAASQATAAARIPRFSTPGPSTSPSFTPTGPQPAQNPTGPQVPPLPVRNGTSAPANGSNAPAAVPASDGGAPGAPSRLPSFGGGQPPVRGGDGPSVSVPADTDSDELTGIGTGPSSLPLLTGNGAGNADSAGNGNGSADPGSVTIPPVAAQDQRLPIFDSLESDWFRRSGKTMTAAPRGTQPATATAQTASTWTSPADEGWRAAQVVAAPAAGETTQAGLPKRVPRANLVPGSVGGGGQDAEGSVSTAPARTAEDVRARLSSFQRGVREGRAAAPQIEEQ